MSGIYIGIDETEFNGEKCCAILLGELNNQQHNAPFFVDLTKDFRTPNAAMVNAKITTALTKVGVEEYFSKF